MRKDRCKNPQNSLDDHQGEPDEGLPDFPCTCLASFPSLNESIAGAGRVIPSSEASSCSCPCPVALPPTALSLSGVQPPDLDAADTSERTVRARTTAICVALPSTAPSLPPFVPPDLDVRDTHESLRPDPDNDPDHDNDDATDADVPSDRNTHTAMDLNEKCGESLAAPPLPPFSQMSCSSFRWGDVTSDALCTDIENVYEELVNWQKNTFSPTSGHAGVDYVREHARLLRAYADRTPLERIALRAVMVMPSLLLQRPHAKAGSKECSVHLQRRLSLWKAGKIGELLDEAQAIQSRLLERDSRSGMTTAKLNRRFSQLIAKGNIHAAITLITEQGKGGVMPLTQQVCAALQEKHPAAQPADSIALISGEPPQVNPIIFEAVTGDVVRKAALATQGAAGPSMADAYVWRRMLASFKSASEELASAIAAVGRRLASEHVDPAGIDALLNNRLIPLDKNPGVRPVGVGEVLRRIIGKSILAILGKDVSKIAGARQLCAGQPGGCEAAIHALRQVFADVGTDAVLLVDADNAFNRLNRAVALHNIRYICPPLSTIVINFYRTPARLFVTGGIELTSTEGTTQGCPLAMAMYALCTLPLINLCGQTATDDCNPATQVWFADDSAAGGRLRALRRFWDILVEHGPAYGYFPKPSKTFLVVKSECHAEAEEMFAGTGIQLTSSGPDLAEKGGQRHLGAAIGSTQFVDAYLDDKVSRWTSLVKSLAEIAATEPHAVYAGFVFGLRHRWTFIQRTMPTTGDHMQPLKDAIRNHLIPSLIKHDLSDNEIEMVSLPARFGGLSLDDPVSDSGRKHQDSIKCTAKLASMIVDGQPTLPGGLDPDKAAKNAVRQEHQEHWKGRADEIQGRLPEPQRRAMELARAKGGSSTLTTIPVAEHGFFFEVKSDFVDHIKLRYCWPLDRLPTTCPCGAKFSMDHAQICKTGGFIHMRHDDPTYLLAKCMKEIHRDVEVEPTLLPLSGETFQYRTANVQPDARADIRVRGFWTDSRNAFFDTRIFYPHASSYRSRSLKSICRQVEMQKKREYGERIRDIEHGSFTPLVFSSCGGMGQEATVVVKKLASSLAARRNEIYSHVIGWLRSCLAFSLARSAIRCIRGSRTLRRKTDLAPVSLVRAETHCDNY